MSPFSTVSRLGAPPAPHCPTSAARNQAALSAWVRGIMISASLVVSGCQLPLPGQQPALNGSSGAQGNALAGQSPNAPESQASTFTQFDDIPIPANADINLQESLILGTEGGWIGRLSIDVGYEMSDMYGFYTEEMPKFSWEQLTTVRSKISTMTYRRGNRVSTITLVPTLTGGTSIDFTVAPGNATVMGSGAS